MPDFPRPVLKKKDRLAGWLIIVFSIIVFAGVTALGRMPKPEREFSFDIHLLPMANAIINSCVALLLVAALFAVKARNYVRHRNLMVAAIIFSVFFFILYITYHFLSGEARFGDLNGDGIVDAAEIAAAGGMRTVYFILLSTHILLAGLALPFILYTAYRGLSGEYAKHKKLARFTWPLWFYVAVSGVAVYLMISPYYQ